MDTTTHVHTQLESGRLGSFATRLYETWKAADGGNKFRLEVTFPEYFNTPKQR